MHRDRIALTLLSLTLAVGAAVSCTTSEPINMNPTGIAGATGSGTAGTGATGTAGNTPGTAGTGTTGTAGATGTAGSTTGTAGATGTAGSTTGTAGATGAGGSNADGGTTDSGTGAMLSFATDIFPFMKTQCTPCHITNTDGQLSMKDATTAFTNLVTNGAAKTNLTCTQLTATNKKRVIAGDPTHSFLYIKVSQTTAQLMPGGCQPAMPEMPQSTLTLTPDQVTKIHDWIMGGAKP